MTTVGSRAIRIALISLACIGAEALGAEAAAPAVALRRTGDWQVEVLLPAGESGSGKSVATSLEVPRATVVSVKGERHDRLPCFNPKAWAGWQKGSPLRGLKAQECTNRGLLDPASLEVRAGPEADAPLFERDKDYAADVEWGSIGRLPEGRIGESQPVYVDYRHALLRIDAILRTRDGRIVLRQGEPHAAAPLPPAVEDGETRLANVYLPGRIARLEPEHLFPILETAYPEPPKPSPTAAEVLLPKTIRKLREGQPLRILAWGDSVTVGSYLSETDRTRWQAQFVARLQQRFPQAKIELVTEAWGGRNTASYLAEPPGSPHNYQEKVLGASPDLIVSEFVNDAGLNPDQVEQRYGKLLADFRAIGAEWIILTPHYVRPDWMGLTREREIDDDPRPYVTGLRTFAARHSVALADASLRWGRLWRQGLPYSTLHLNAINHPDARGMRLFADSLMGLFP